MLDFIREQFGRLTVKIDALHGDVTNSKIRMSGLEAEFGHVRIGLAEVNSRLDRIDARMGRVERRLDLADAT